MKCDFLGALSLMSSRVEVCSLLHHQPGIQQSKAISETSRKHALLYYVLMYVINKHVAALLSSHTCELEGFHVGG